jgi:hypothetical protein
MRCCHDEGIMLETETIQNRDMNLLRAMSYVFSILLYLQDEPLCKECEAFADVLDSTREKFIDIEKAVNRNRDMPQGIRKLLTNIYVVLADLKIPDNPVSQKISGNCHLPSGICLAESAKGLYDKLEESIYEEEASSANGS